MHFIQRSWGNETVVYVMDSAETHQLSAAGALLLEQLIDGPTDIAALENHFKSVCDEDLGPQEVADLVKNTVESIRKIGLIETIETSP